MNVRAGKRNSKQIMKLEMKFPQQLTNLPTEPLKTGRQNEQSDKNEHKGNLYRKP